MNLSLGIHNKSNMNTKYVTLVKDNNNTKIENIIISLEEIVLSFDLYKYKKYETTIKPNPFTVASILIEDPW